MSEMVEQARPAEATLQGARPQETAEQRPAEDIQKTIEEYRRIQSGLQSALERARRELEEARKSITATEQEKQQLAAQIADYEAKLKELSEALERHQLEAKTRAAEARRAHIVATQFPHLAPLLEAGALPAYENDEQFAEALQKISGALLKAAQSQMAAAMAGAKPAASPPAGGRSPADPDKLWKEMQIAMEKGDWETYSRLRDEWYESLTK